MRTRSLDETGARNAFSTMEKKRSASEKFAAADDPTPAKATAQCSVASVYHANIAGTTRAVTVVWSKNLINHTLSLAVERWAEGGEGLQATATCKVELKPWPFWSKKGFKSLEVDDLRVDLFWDLRSAKFSGSPEPSAGYYVAMVCSDEVVLLLGDCKMEAYKRTKSRPSLVDAVLVSKRENVVGKKCFSTRARIDDRKEHEIVVENSISVTSKPEMWISVDGIILIHVSNLHWKFRGNQTILVERIPVQVFWDVHDWLFASPGAGYALFIFKPTPANGSDAPQPGAEAESSARHPADDSPTEFSFFLHAWRVE